MSDSRLFLAGLLLTAAVLAVVVFLVNRFRTRRRPQPQDSAALHASTQADAGTVSSLPPETRLTPVPGESFPYVAMRVGLMLLALVVAGGFVLILLPQGTIDWMAHAFASRSSEGAEPEPIAFLFLGDEVRDGEFHIRGVVRNISTKPIEKLDTTIRLYSSTGQLLETRSVRMDAETIPPDAIAQFHLVYPDYSGQFGSYSVEFVRRQGEVMPYKDMRGARGRD